jgi:hypothetical protein
MALPTCSGEGFLATCVIASVIAFSYIMGWEPVTAAKQVIRARALAANTDRLFLRLRAMTKEKKNDPLQIDLLYKVDFSEYGLGKREWIRKFFRFVFSSGG